MCQGVCTLQPTNSLQNGSKCFIYQCLESYKQVQIGSKLHDWVQYGLKWFKMVIMVQDNSKWIKLVENVPKGLKLVQRIKTKK